MVDRDSADAMINYFNSLRGKFMRKFLGLPIYIGHPDDPEYGQLQNASIYGRIENLKVEGNALWILARWTNLGKKLFGGGFLCHLSPRWMMRKIRDKLFQPVRLISVGMTNRPNLCCSNDSLVDEDAKCVQPANNEENVHKVYVKNFPENETSTNPEQAVVSEGILCVKLIDNQKDATKVLNKNETNLSIGGLHVSSMTKNLSGRPEEQSAKDKILTLVYERMANFGEDYQAAWNTVKHSHPALFMKNF
jgi:hypothetical protein